MAAIYSNTYYRPDIGEKLFNQPSNTRAEGYGNKFIQSVIHGKTDEEFATAEMAILLNNGRGVTVGVRTRQ